MQQCRFFSTTAGTHQDPMTEQNFCPIPIFNSAPYMLAPTWAWRIPSQRISSGYGVWSTRGAMVLENPFRQTDWAAGSSAFPPQVKRVAYNAAAPQQLIAACTVAAPQQNEWAAYISEIHRQFEEINYALKVLWRRRPPASQNLCGRHWWR